MARRATHEAEEARLAVVIADRIMQVLETHPVFRTEYGRNEDFALQFGISRSTASRILRGVMVPQTALLVEIAKKLGVTIEWLTGQTSEGFETLRKVRPARFEYWPPQVVDGVPMPPFTMPTTRIPKGIAIGLVGAIVWPDHSLHPYVAPGETVFVQSRREPFGGAVHVLHWRHGLLEAAYISAYGTEARFALKALNGRTETIAAADIAFGFPADSGSLPAPSREPQEVPLSAGDISQPALRVLGLLVGRLSFTEHGVLRV